MKRRLSLLFAILLVFSMVILLPPDTAQADAVLSITADVSNIRYSKLFKDKGIEADVTFHVKMNTDGVPKKLKDQYAFRTSTLTWNSNITSNYEYPVFECHHILNNDNIEIGTYTITVSVVATNGNIYSASTTITVTQNDVSMVCTPEIIKTNMTQTDVANDNKTLGKKKYSDFSNMFSSTNITIPGLNQNFIPQSVAYDDKLGYYYISGYSSSGDASSLVILDSSGNYVKSLRLQKTNGKNYKGHAGGVSYSDSYIFVTSDNNVYSLSKSEVLNLKDGSNIPFVNNKKLNSEGSYATTSGDLFLTGTFAQNRAEVLEKNLQTKIGNTTWYLPLCEIYSEKNNNISNTPDYFILTPYKIQGMARDSKGNFYFSQSYGRTQASTILVYSDILATKSVGKKEVNGKKIPVYSYTNAKLIKSITAPPLSEGICIKNDELYIIFESGATKYRENGGIDPLDTILKAKL